MKDVCQTAKAIKPDIEIHILILNKPSGFYPDAADVAVLKQGIADAAKAGADGVVFGALDAQDGLNLPVLKELAAVSHLDKTFHRAFDRIPNQAEALEHLISLGFARVLTSGRPGKAPDHTVEIKKLVDRAAGRICIVAGGGIRSGNLAEIQAATHVPVLHMSCRREDGRKPTDRDIVRKVVSLCRSQALFA